MTIPTTPSAPFSHPRHYPNQKPGSRLNPALPPHTLSGTIHLPRSLSEVCGFFFLNLYLLPPQVRPPSILGYFSSLSRWSFFTAPCVPSTFSWNLKVGRGSGGETQGKGVADYHSSCHLELLSDWATVSPKVGFCYFS